MPRLKPVKQWSKRLLFWVALAAALSLHLLIFGPFRIRPPETKGEAKPTTGVCVTFQPAGNPWERELAAFCDIRNPALLTEADPVHGFSQFLKTPPPTPYTSTRQPPTTPAIQPPARFADAPAAPALPPLPEAIGRHWPANLPAENDAPERAALPAGMLWRFADGTPLAGPPTLPGEAVQAALADKAPAGPTRFEVVLPPRPQQSRLRLTDSCGNAALDRLALDGLTRRLREWERERLIRKPGRDLERFAEENHFIQTVEAEWRLTPSRPATPSATPQP
jgi:hypothetical protein